MQDLIIKIKDKTKGVVELIGFDCDPIITNSDNVIFVNLNIESPALLIGKGGEGLDSLQHIVRSMLGREMSEHQKTIVVDIAGYRDKKIEGTKKHAREKAFTVLATGIAEELPPMSSFERREVHMVIANIADVESESVGIGRDRRIVIKPKKNSE